MSVSPTPVVAIFVLTLVGTFLFPLLRGQTKTRKVLWAAVYVLLEIILVLAIAQVHMLVVYVIALGMILGYLIFGRK